MSGAEQVIPLERVEREAKEAAKAHSDVNAVCPYPFTSDAGHAYALFFRQARNEIAATGAAATAGV